MKTSILKCVALAAMALGLQPALADTPAFPGAEGYGMYTVGGRGGKVYHVTNLSDDGKAGSLRYAVNQKGARTIVFDVSGTIELNSALSINNGNITIAGQTAPGDGICLKNYHVYVNSSDVILRFLRFRLGTDKPDGYNADGTPYQDRDAIWGRNKTNIILDHCSMSWCTDECASFYGNTNFTMQWCLIAESLRGSMHPKGYHGYGGIWGGQGASFHHNLLAHHDSRNPRLCGSRYTNQPELEKVDLRNNVVYNWGETNSGYAGEGGSYNFVNNYYKAGPATGANIRYRIFEAYADDGTNKQPQGVYGKFYMKGNFMEGKGENWDWNGMDVNNGNNYAMNKQSLTSYTEFEHAKVTTHTATKAFDKVLALAGACKSRDAVDARIAKEAKNGTATYRGSVLGGQGIIDKTSDVGGWPTLKSAEAPIDTDGDGMPDTWEKAWGLNPEDATDGSALAADGSGYTNLEIYMNSLVCDIMVSGLQDALTPCDLECKSAPAVPDSAKLVKHGGGSCIQTVDKGTEIASFFFNWENATGVKVTGDLPEGVGYTINNADKSITFSGIAEGDGGVYEATVTTTGGLGEASYNLQITVRSSGYSVEKRPFNFVVGVDGDFKAAKAAAEKSRNGRFYIFIPNGSYDIGSLTGDDNQMTTWTAGTVSFIGQNVDKTTIYNKAINEAIGTTATFYFKSSARDLYMQDLTLQNRGQAPEGSSAARFVVIRDEGKKNTFKTVRLLSGQDTYYSRTDRSYWEGCDIHGTVDFICGYGNVFFNQSRIYLESRTNNVITAPATKEDTWGYVFRDCLIDGDGINNNSYRLGRSWQGTPKAVFINTRMNVLPIAAGWGDLMNVNPTLFAEYNSTDRYGNGVDLSQRRSVYSKDGNTVYINPVLSAADAAQYTIANVLAGTDNWAPDNDCRQVSAPNVRAEGNKLKWAHKDSALCYFIFKNGVYLANTAENSYEVPSTATTDDVFTLRSANAMGGLGPESKGVSTQGIVSTKSTSIFYFNNGATTSTAGNDINDRWNCTDEGKDGYGWAITSRNDKNILYGVDITYYGKTYKTFKNSNGAQSTVYLPEGLKANKVTFVGYSNSEEATATLTEINGKATDLPLNVNTSTANHASNPAQVSYTFDREVCDHFTFTFTGAQVCFIMVLDVEECDCESNHDTTGLTSTPSAIEIQEGQIYDLLGRPVKDLQPGKVYLRKGQKFKVK